MDTKDLWRQILSEIELEISPANFATWFKNTDLREKQNDQMLISVPNIFVKEWLEDKYCKLILKTTRNHLPEIKMINYAIAIQSPAQPQIHKSEESHHAKEQLTFKESYVDPGTNLNPKYTFENFVVGAFNELAYAAGQAIIKNLGLLYNPFFVYGGVGLGKTHLIQAIGNTVKKQKTSIKIQYISAEKFFKELIEAIQHGETNLFKDKYRACNLLIVDDIQFISGKNAIQEEIFHTFNALYENNNQIIFSSDRPPAAIHNLEERVRSRFEGGLIVDINTPDFETKLAILKSKLREKNIEVKQEILEYLAKTIKDNIRELEGALNSILSRSYLFSKELTLEEVQKTLSKNIKPKKVITPKEVIQCVANFYDIPAKNLLEKTRRKEIVRARQIAMYILREDFNASLPFIGQEFGGKDHTTVLYACEKIKNEIKINERLREELKYLKEQLYNIV